MFNSVPSSPTVHRSMPALTPPLSSRLEGRAQQISHDSKQLLRFEAMNGRLYGAASSDRKGNIKVVPKTNKCNQRFDVTPDAEYILYILPQKLSRETRRTRVVRMDLSLKSPSSKFHGECGPRAFSKSRGRSTEENPHSHTPLALGDSIALRPGEIADMRSDRTY